MAQQQMSVTMTGFAASHPSRSDGTEDLVTFRMASTPSWNSNGVWREGSPLFINVQCWGKLGDNVLSCVVKGAPLVIAGRMTSYSFKPDNPRKNAKGEPYFEEIWRVRATNVGLDLSHSQSKWQRPVKEVDAADADAADGAENTEASANIGGFAGLSDVPAGAAAPVGGDDAASHNDSVDTDGAAAFNGASDNEDALAPF